MQLVLLQVDTEYMLSRYVMMIWLYLFGVRLRESTAPRPRRHKALYQPRPSPARILISPVRLESGEG